MEHFNNLSKHQVKKITETMEAELERYRIYKSFVLTPEELNITSNTFPVFTAEDIAKCLRFCEQIDQAVQQLPKRQKSIIQEKYIHLESEYRTDREVYEEILDPPISSLTYMKARKNALLNLSLILGRNIGLEIRDSV